MWLRLNPMSRDRHIANLCGHARHCIVRAVLTASLAALLSVAAAAANAACSSPNSVIGPLPDSVSGRQYEIYVSLPMAMPTIRASAIRCSSWRTAAAPSPI